MKAVFVSVCLILLGACKDEAVQQSESTPRDAEVLKATWEDDSRGLALALGSGWRTVTVSNNQDTAVTTIGRILRKRLLADVVPRIVITAEPLTTEQVNMTDRSLFIRILNDLRAVGKAPNTRVTRTAWSTRTLGTHIVGDLEIAFATKTDTKKEQEIIQRSWVLRRTDITPPELITLSASYLSQDGQRAGSEIEAILTTLRIDMKKTSPSTTP